jgi:hypothetical protein
MAFEVGVGEGNTERVQLSGIDRQSSVFYAVGLFTGNTALVPSAAY